VAGLAGTAIRSLRANGHTVNVSDLYEMDWRAPVSHQDFVVRSDDQYLDVSREQGHSLSHGTAARDIVAEQRKLADADLVLLHFPMWWFSMPAILKGWVDRVLSYGFAYSAENRYDTGHMHGKKAMLCVTTGAPSTLYQPHGVDGHLMHLLWPIHNGILAYTGFAVLPPTVVWAPASMTPEQRRQSLTTYGDKLRTISSVDPLFFHPASDYDESGRLLPGVEARSGFQWNPTAGQSFSEAATLHTTPAIS
jgi:NAD(P)H dehydrogenase (quinone)